MKCNGKLLLESEKGNLVGGEVRARQGVAVQNLGSPAGVTTLVLFGQDFILKDQIEREEREVAAIARRVAELDAEMKRMQREALAGKPLDADALSAARAEKAQSLKAIELRKKRLITLHDTFDLHTPSQVVVRGTLYPGDGDRKPRQALGNTDGEEHDHPALRPGAGKGRGEGLVRSFACRHIFRIPRGYTPRSFPGCPSAGTGSCTWWRSSSRTCCSPTS